MDRCRAYALSSGQAGVCIQSARVCRPGDEPACLPKPEPRNGWVPRHARPLRDKQLLNGTIFRFPSHVASVCVIKGLCVAADFTVGRAAREGEPGSQTLSEAGRPQLFFQCY